MTVRALRFPEGVACDGERLYVANSGGGDVREYTKEGHLLRIFAPFGLPAGVAVHNGALYIADRESGSVCRIDLRTEVRTVLLENLRAPSALWADEETLAVAEAGAHRITLYDKVTLQVSAVFGNLEGVAGKGPRPVQPTGLVGCDDGTLWFVDAERSALRFMEGDRVVTAVGDGLFSDGDSYAAPVFRGIACGRIGDGCGGGRLFVADTYNGKIKAYDPQSERMMTLLEGLREPTGICKTGCSLYIAETGAHRVVRFDLSSMTMTPLPV